MNSGLLFKNLEDGFMWALIYGLIYTVKRCFPWKENADLCSLRDLWWCIIGDLNVTWFL